MEYREESNENEGVINLLLKHATDGKVKKLFLDKYNSVYQYKSTEDYAYLIIISGNFTFVNNKGIIHQISRDIIDKLDDQLVATISSLVQTGEISGHDGGPIQEIIQMNLFDNVITA